MAVVAGEVLTRVRGQVMRCLNNLVGGSGHLASIDLVPGSFVVTAAEMLADGLTEYHFEALGCWVSEFTVAGEDQGQEPELLCGTIVLDQDFELTRDAEGKVRLSPWTCQDPDF